MRRTLPAVAALSVGLALTLSGCFANPLEQLTGDLIEGGVEQIIEDQTGVDVDVNGDGASLPDGFPSEIPVPDGKIGFSAGADGTYTVAFEVADAAAIDATIAELIASGFTQTAEFDLGDGAGTSSFENGDYVVALISAPMDAGGYSLQYTVVPAGQ